MVGGSLTGATFNANVVTFESSPSETVRVIFAAPLALAIGVRVTVQFGYVPPITIPEVAISAVFEEALVTEPVQVRVESTSLMVKAKAEVLVSSLIF